MLQKISLKNYRNLNLETTPGTNGNLIIEQNGHGKSNFLESIYLAGTGKPFKSIGNFKELIRYGEEFAKAELDFSGTILEIVISNGDRTQKKFILSGKRKPVSKIAGKFPCVLFAPHVVDLVSTDPSSRRDDINTFLSQIKSEFFSTLTRYQKVLKNRNALLKHIRDHNGDRSELDYWTNELTKLATYIFSVRKEYFIDIEPDLGDAASLIYNSNSPDFSVEYLPFRSEAEWNSKRYLIELTNKFCDNQDKEVIVGQTLYGPHKDDYQMVLSEENLKFVGSRGQQRIAVFIWKLAQLAYLKKHTDEPVVFLIDDLMSELDNIHREKVAEVLLGLETQFFLTSADKNEIPQTLIEQCKRIEIS